MNIGVSTFVLQGGHSGIATYVRELLRFLQLEDRENHYDLWMARRESALVETTNPHFHKRMLPASLSAPVPNLLWHNTALAWPSAKYDLLHIPSARRIPILKRTRVVATVHDLAAFSVENKYDCARMFFNRRFVPAMIRNADHVIAVSEATRDDLLKHVHCPEERISVVYSGIDHGRFQPIPKEQACDRLRTLHGLEKPFIVYVSRLEHPAKNHLRLIEAFERLKLENDSAHQLVLAGADWSGARIIRQRAAESPVRDDILFPGFVPQESLPLLYAGCDLMVFPSLFEGFGFPILEALSCGAPVACSNTSSMREIACDVVPTFDPLDGEALFRAMEGILTFGWSPEQRRRGIEYAARFDWRKTAAQTLEIYRSVA